MLQIVACMSAMQQLASQKSYNICTYSKTGLMDLIFPEKSLFLKNVYIIALMYKIESNEECCIRF